MSDNGYDAASAANENKGPAPEINLGDFAVTVAIIDTVSKRGAFEGQELADVGRLRERLVTFIDYHKPNEEADPQVESVTTESLDTAETEVIDFEDAPEPQE